MKRYVSPEIEKITFDSRDIITVSDAGSGAVGSLPSTPILPYGIDEGTIYSDN